MEESFSSLTASARSILILLPSQPDFDQVAAGLALYLSLKNTKEVFVVCPTPMLVEFNRLIGVNQITTESGNKNLTIKFDQYPAENVERVSADVENGMFYLTVIPKPGQVSPKKENIELSYSGVSADTIILIGGANESHFPLLMTLDVQAAKLVYLGTRDLAMTQGKSLISFARPASCLSEIAAALIKESGLNFDADIATNLVLGIEKGSSHFSSEETTPETFELFAQLLRAGGQRQVKLPAVRAEEKVTPAEKAPTDWLEPKIYKGASIS
jgi:hypothetical protein